MQLDISNIFIAFVKFFITATQITHTVSFKYFLSYKQNRAEYLLDNIVMIIDIETMP